MKLNAKGLSSHTAGCRSIAECTHSSLSSKKKVSYDRIYIYILYIDTEGIRKVEEDKIPQYKYKLLLRVYCLRIDQPPGFDHIPLSTHRQIDNKIDFFLNYTLVRLKLLLRVYCLRIDNRMGSNPGGWGGELGERDYLHFPRPNSDRIHLMKSPIFCGSLGRSRAENSNLCKNF